MAFPRIPRRWRLRTLMIVVALCAVGLVAFRVYIVERAPVYRLIRQLRTGSPQARSEAAVRIGLMGPRAAFAADALTSALDDPDPGVQTAAMYALVRVGSRSPRLLQALVAEIVSPSTPAPGLGPSPISQFLDEAPPRGWPLSDGGFSDGDPVGALKVLRPPAALVVPMLKTTLKHRESWLHPNILAALCAMASWSDPPSPELAEALAAVLAAERFGHRRQTAEALARLDRKVQEKAVARLAEDLRELESARAFEAALLLPLLADGTATAMATLLEQARGGDEHQRLIALLLLARYGERATPAAPALVRLMTERDADRRIDLVLSFDWGESFNPRDDYNIFWSMYPDLGNPGETSVVALGVRALKAMGPGVERQAIRDLIAVLRDPAQGDDRKRGAIAALGEFGPGVAESALRAALNDPSRSVRDDAADALRAIAEGRARR